MTPEKETYVAFDAARSVYRAVRRVITELGGHRIQRSLYKLPGSIDRREAMRRLVRAAPVGATFLIIAGDGDSLEHDGRE